MYSEKKHVLIFGSGSDIAIELIKKIHPSYSLSIAARKIDCSGSGSVFNIDISDPSTFDLVFSQAIEKHGPIHAVVNCIGSILLKPAHLLTDSDWVETLNTNLTSCFYIARAAGKYMLKTGGSVVFLSTAASLVGLPNHEAISAAKAGINGLMMSAAATYAANDLRFNCVAPGLVDTKLSRAIMSNARSLAVSLKLHPLGRVGSC